MSFCHLHVHSCFSMLDGADTPAALCKSAKDIGMSALALTDHHGLYGAVRFAQAARDEGIKPIFGVELTLTDESHIVLLARNEEGWRNLCRIITRAHLDSLLHRPRADPDVIARHQEGLFVLTGCRRGRLYRALMEEGTGAARGVARELASLFGRERLFIELGRPLERFEENRENHQLADIAEELDLRLAATNDVHHAIHDDYRVHDVLTCIRLIQRVTVPHPERPLNGEKYLKAESEMRELFSDFPEALANTEFIARECEVKVEFSGWRLPVVDCTLSPGERVGVRDVPRTGPPKRPSPVPSLRSGPTSPIGRGGYVPPLVPPQAGGGEAANGETEGGRGEGDSMALLRQIANEGLQRRLGGNVGPEYHERLREELELIEEMGFVDYFLICYDIVRAARAKGIRTTGRGSAGNSLVAFALDIVGPDPLVHGMIFQRFMNRERRELPDIDVDFCSRRRDEVLEYVYARYGEDRVAAVATLNTFRARSAVRDVAKALGYSPEEIDDIARVFPFLSSGSLMSSWKNTPEIRNCRVDLSAVAEVVAIADRIAGFPRHLGIHVGGIVISDRELTDYVPLQQSTKGIVICQYDKDDVEALGLVKLDLLGLRMHSAIERCLDLVERSTGIRPDIDRVPLNDEATYELMREARTVGCFQLESPGERSLQTRLLPLAFRDVIANISLFRPGPVQADMVSPFVERRHGRQEIPWIHPRLEPILRETYGVVTYQEQVLLIAHEIAGFSLAEADSLRRAMTKSISTEDLEAIKRRFIWGALENGVSREDAEDIFRQIAGFAAYGFCKGHAACFGLIAYQSAYLKAHYPAEFLAGVLSNEPMGYYSARTIVEDAKRCGVQVLRVDVNASEEQYSVENGAIRIGLLQVAGLSEASQRSIVEGRRARPYESLLDFCRRARVDRDALENLILAGAFDDLPAYAPEPRPPLIWLPSGATDKHPLVPVRADALDHRRRLIWLLPLIIEAAGVSDDGQVSISEVGPNLEKLDPLSPRERAGVRAIDLHIEKELILADYQAIHLSPLRHPVALVRPMLKERGCLTSLELLEARTGSRVRAGGVVVSRNRPPTKSGRIVVFVTLEDEMGLFDAVVFENAYYRLRSIIFGHDTLIVEGRVDRQSGTALSLIVDGAEPLNPFERPVEGALQPGPGDFSHVRLLRERVHPTEADHPVYA